MCEREREREGVCEREREREGEGVCEGGREREVGYERVTSDGRHLQQEVLQLRQLAGDGGH